MDKKLWRKLELKEKFREKLLDSIYALIALVGVVLFWGSALYGFYKLVTKFVV